MQYRQISENYAVAPQISVEDVAIIEAAGFKSVICNRPDDEDPGQPSAAEIERAVQDAGMEFRWIPVVGGTMGPEHVSEQANALDELPGPVLAYCRSGTRSTNLYLGSQQRG